MPLSRVEAVVPGVVGAQRSPSAHDRELGDIQRRVLWRLNSRLQPLWEAHGTEQSRRLALQATPAHQLQALYWFTQAALAHVGPRNFTGLLDLPRERIIEYLLDHGMPGSQVLIRAEAEGIDLDIPQWGYYPSDELVEARGRAFAVDATCEGQGTIHLEYSSSEGFTGPAHWLFALCKHLSQSTGARLPVHWFFHELEAHGRLHLHGPIADGLGIHARLRASHGVIYAQGDTRQRVLAFIDA